MSAGDLLSQIRDDLRAAPDEMVIYLEGKTDPNFLFALLGLSSPADGLHEGVLVKGLRDEGSKKGSGSTAVMARVDVARRTHLKRVFGIVDGDGRTLDQLRPHFDPPHAGPLYHWKAYCIENLLAKTGWPSVWGGEPDWSIELSNYGPYVALNRIGVEARSILESLGIMKHTNLGRGDLLKSSDEISAMLEAGKGRLQSFAIEQRFDEELVAFNETIRRSLDQTHCLLNGKWLLRHLAPTITKRNPDQCQYDWIAHARSSGGLLEVREWWERVTGSPP